jgi:ell wall binding domain 2 (CWB2)
MPKRSIRLMAVPFLMVTGAATTIALGATSATADPAMTATTLAPAPGGTAPSLTGMACPGPSSCTGVGDQSLTGTGIEQAVITTETNGTWTVTPAPLPADADQSSPAGSALDSIACPVIGTCVAVGFYATTGGETLPLVDTELAGTWSGASVPASAMPGLPGASFTFGPIACPTTGGCVAAFNQVVPSGPTPTLPGDNQPLPFVGVQSGGTWQFDPVRAPSTADVNPEGQLDSISGVACPAAGPCLGVGSYKTSVTTGTETAFDTLPMVITEANGAWSGTPTSPPASTGEDEDATLNAVSCPPVGPCTAIGESNDTSTAFTDTGSSTTWQAPVTLPPPSEGFATPTLAGGISCPASGSCAVVGSYVDQRDPNGSADNFQTHLRAFLAIQSNGTWVATPAAAPADAAAVPNSSLDPVGCSPQGDCAAAGEYAQGSAGEPTAAYAVTFSFPLVSVTRLFGQDAIGTSIAVSQAEFPTAGSASAVVLARSDFFSDALAGGPLAAKEGGPLLITPGAAERSTLDPRVLAEIERVLPGGQMVYVLGGAAALGPDIDNQLAFLGYTVVREAGADEYATAVDIAQALGNPVTVFEATGLNFADALSAVPAAISVHGAILLTNGSTQAPETAAYLAAHATDTRYAIGGPLAAAGADPSAVAVFGQDLYDTSAAVAARFFPDASVFGAATGTNFPDALSGGVFMGAPATVGPMLLVEPAGALPASIDDYLSDTAASLGAGYVFGGTLAVGDDVLLELAEAG